MFGVRLLFAHPEVSGRSCLDCHKYLYDNDGKITKRVGLPVMRPPGIVTPCCQCPKIPEDKPKHWHYAEDLNEKNSEAFVHYMQCRATGRFPNDPIVSRNAAIIRKVLDDQDRLLLHRIIARLGMK